MKPSLHAKRVNHAFLPPSLPPPALSLKISRLSARYKRIAMIQPPVTTSPVPDMPHAPPPAPALNALLIMAHVHGVAASGGDLLHRFAANGRDLQQEEWLLAARHSV